MQRLSSCSRHEPDAGEHAPPEVALGETLALRTMHNRVRPRGLAARRVLEDLLGFPHRVQRVSASAYFDWRRTAVLGAAPDWA